jgi:hypothetical protein
MVQSFQQPRQNTAVTGHYLRHTNATSARAALTSRKRRARLPDLRAGIAAIIVDRGDNIFVLRDQEVTTMTGAPESTTMITSPLFLLAANGSSAAGSSCAHLAANGVPSASGDLNSAASSLIPFRRTRCMSLRQPGVPAHFGEAGHESHLDGHQL